MSKMRVLHTSDIHLGEFPGPIVAGENARMMDTVKCMNFLADKAEDESPDAILISGDLFNKAQLWDKQRLKEIGFASIWLRRLADVAPVVLMFGTNTHENLDTFDNLRDMRIPNLNIVTTPEMLILNTNSGPLQVAAIPGFDKGYFRAQNPGMAPDDENMMCSELLGDIIMGLGSQIDQAYPSVLMSHYTVVGCELDNGQHVFMQNEVVLPKEAIAAALFDLVCLGHIHRAQKVGGCGRPVYYAGSLNALSFNEEGQDKGFWIHEIDLDLPYDNISSRFIKTPSRQFLTMNIDFRNATDLQAEIDWQLAGISEHGTLLLFDTTGKIVRVHYQCNEEQKKQLNQKAMEQTLYKGGAFYVQEIRPVNVITALSKQEMNESEGPLSNLIVWGQAETIAAEEVKALIALAQPFVDQVSANMPTGKLAGVFEPKRLEVKNYRSYKEESFDFSRVNFATVNGPNGVGKSAFFMDAVCDCLFEDPREGDLTGWISSPDARSGSMAFEFGMGDTDWRVIRTRAKSGKTTLALQQLVDGSWEDRSGAKTVETQNKIIALLGMDCATFRCCALIMQDAYGLFMEADKTERMEVLANILGLNVYEQLTELAKAQATEVNRRLTVAKSKLAELEEKLKGKPQLEADLKQVENETAIVASEIFTKQEELRRAEDQVRQLEAKAARSEELEAQIETFAGKIAEKQQEQWKLQEQLQRANKMLEAEPQIIAKVSELEKVKQQITELKAKQPRLNEAQAEETRVVSELTRVEASLKKLIIQVADTERALADKETLKQVVLDYQKAQADLKAIDTLGERWLELNGQVKEAANAVDRAVFEFETRRQGLEKELDTLRNKAAMLEDSGCIDHEQATCRFLADAQEAKTRMAAVQADLLQLDALEPEHLEQVQQTWRNLNEKCAALGYQPAERTRLKTLVATLQPKAEQAAQLTAKEELLQVLQVQKRETQEQKAVLAERLDKIRATICNLAEELKELPVLELRAPKLETWAKAKDELPAARQLAVTATERLKALDQEIATKEVQVETLYGERADCLIAITQLQPAIDERSITQNQIKRQSEKQNQLYAQTGGLRAQLEALAKDEEARQVVIADIEPTAQELVRYQTLARAFGIDGIPFSIVRSVVPELGAMANDILGQMTGGKMSLEMRTERVQKSNKKEVNALEIWITDYQRGSLPYKSRSGGQKVKAALSVAFALADLKARRAGIQLGMMFVDEPPFLDAEGTEAYCDALELLSQRYPNMRVIAISHDPRMKARFPQQIDVLDMGEDGSKVVMAA